MTTGTTDGWKIEKLNDHEIKLTPPNGVKIKDDLSIEEIVSDLTLELAKRRNPNKLNATCSIQIGA